MAQLPGSPSDTRPFLPQSVRPAICLSPAKRLAGWRLLKTHAQWDHGQHSQLPSRLIRWTGQLAPPVLTGTENADTAWAGLPPHGIQHEVNTPPRTKELRQTARQVDFLTCDPWPPCALRVVRISSAHSGHPAGNTVDNGYPTKAIAKTLPPQLQLREGRETRCAGIPLWTEQITGSPSAR